MSAAARGYFVAFEGGEGTGKSTLLGTVASRLRTRGHDVLETREPGGTPLGQALRRLVLDPAGSGGAPTPRTEALLYAADRAQHVETVLRPALAAGRVVLTDRYVDSSLAYQGTARGVGDTAALAGWATGGLLPDLTVLLDLDPRVGLRRAAARSAPDRLEGASMDFHDAVRQAFLDLAADAPDRYLVIDAGRRPEQVAETVWQAVEAAVGARPS